MESPGDQAALDQDHETLKLYSWRLKELSEAGYDDDAASLIAAEKDIDLHEACALLERGCPQETALRILF